MTPVTRALFDYHRRAVSQPRVERVAAALAAQIGRADSLLDIGAGDGIVGEAVGSRVGASRVEGVDVLVQPNAVIPVTAYDGEHLPFEDGAFDAVTLSDMLHHAEHPERVLREALRVAKHVVAIKDHFRFGHVTGAVLLAMDVVGNAASGVFVRGRYLAPSGWSVLVREADGRIAGLTWPLRIHDAPWRFVTGDRLQFAARIERAGEGAAPGVPLPSDDGSVRS